MPPPVGKITNFFQPFIRKRADEFDGDEIVVIKQTPSSLASVAPLQTATRPRSPFPAAKKPPKLPQSNSTPQLRPQQSSPTAANRSSGKAKHRDTPLASLSIKSARSQTPPATKPLQSTQRSPLSVRTAKTDLPPPPPSSADDPHKPLTSSFSSNASKRITVNGISGVTDSDDGSDDDLEDFTAFLPSSKRVRLTPPSTTPRAVSSMPRQSYKSIMSVTTHKPARYSLSDLLKHKEAEESSAARVRKIEAELEQLDQVKAKTEDLFVDDDDKTRIMAAVDRTELMQESGDFFFFKSARSMVKPLPWPNDDSLGVPMKTQKQRDAIVRSGYLEDLAGERAVTPKILRWLENQIQTDASRLNGAHLRILQTACREQDLPMLVKECQLGDVYELRRTSIDPLGDLPSDLSNQLRLLCILADEIVSSKQSAQLIRDLALLNIDANIRSSVSLQQDVEDSLQAIFSSTRDHLDTAIGKACKLIIDDDLLTQQQTAQVIACFPASTIELHRFRRRLALQYILNANTVTLQTLCDLATGKQVLAKLLKDEIYHVKQDTDWSLFFWVMHVLDIAIDVGFSDFAFTVAGTSKHERALFDTQVDNIAQRLRQIANSIRDSGTSHLRRIEAKGALERLISRLELTVRTQSKQRKGTFDDTGAQSILGNFMS